MARITILSLQQANAKLASENEALRKQVLDLHKDIEIAREQAESYKLGSEVALEALNAELAAPPAPAPKRTAYVMPAWQAERAALMAKAKQAAMAMGCTVKV